VAGEWITAITATHVLRAVAAAGGDAAGLATRFKVDPGASFERRIPVQTLSQLWEAAMRATGRRDLPVLAATDAEHDERSLIAFAAANQPHLGACVDIIERYFPVVASSHRWRVVRKAEVIHLLCSPPGPLHRLGWQAHLEFEAIDHVATARRLSGGLARPLDVRFSHPDPPPECVEALTRIAGIAPSFGQCTCELVYRRSALDLPIRGARPSLSKVIERQLDRLLASIIPEMDVAARVKEVVDELLREGHLVSVDEVARALHLSRRSLERALAREGTSAGLLLAEARGRLARAWLPSHSVEETASRLGYADPRTFARAFKRWTGMSPGTYRRRSRGPRGA
jgi:AraC-like DNA-binding protein